MPRAISASPTLATLAMGPSGSGMTSPMGPAQEELQAKGFRQRRVEGGV